MDDDSRIAETLAKLRTRLNDKEEIDKFGRMSRDEDFYYSNLVTGALMALIFIAVICGVYCNSEHLPISMETVCVVAALLFGGGCFWLFVDAREKSRSNKLSASERLVVVTNQRVLSLHMSNFDILELGPQSEIFEIADTEGITTIAMADGKKIRMKKEADALLLKFKTYSPEV